MKNIPIGEVLLNYGYISEEQLDQALIYQSEHKEKRLGAVLMELGFVSELQVLEALGKRLELPIVDLSQEYLDLEVVTKVPEALAMKYNILAIAEEGQILRVVVNDPLNFYGLEDIRQLTGMYLQVCLSPLQPLKQAMEYCYAEVAAKKAAVQANMNKELDFNEMELADDANDDGDEDAPIIKLMNSLVMRAYNSGASDIHIEPFENETIVRMRIDGVILEYVTLKKSIQAPLIARIKIMGEMDIAEKRLPQDGHFKMRLEDGKKLNLRVSVLPTVFGEKAVLRLLNSQTAIDHSGTFGMMQEDYERFAPILNSPNGILYITGPTGSGKTTTLYMMLEYLSRRSVNISTIEDPVEKNLPKLNQTQVNNVAGLTFDSGLRALLRQDPDIIMVGETRDAETASISVRAAITGHLVLSTLHTNSAVASVVRLLDMGLEPYMVANSLVGIVAQRLMRKVCQECANEIETTKEERAILGEQVTRKKVPVGCSRCNNTGYKGRIAVHEIIVFDKTIKGMITNGESVEAMEAYAVNHQGMKLLKNRAIELVASGVTTTEELLKVTYYE